MYQNRMRFRSILNLFLFDWNRNKTVSVFFYVEYCFSSLATQSEKLWSPLPSARLYLRITLKNRTAIPATRVWSLPGIVGIEYDPVKHDKIRWHYSLLISYSSCRCILLSISGFELDPHYCQLPVAEEVQPERNSCPVVLTVVRIVLDSNYIRQTSDRLPVIPVS